MEGRYEKLGTVESLRNILSEICIETLEKSQVLLHHRFSSYLTTLEINKKTSLPAICSNFFFLKNSNPIYFRFSPSISINSTGMQKKSFHTVKEIDFDALC